jgi:hypothetical protein
MRMRMRMRIVMGLVTRTHYECDIYCGEEIIFTKKEYKDYLSYFIW